MRKLIMVLCLAMATISAQQPLTNERADSLSYAAFQNGDLHQLEELANTCIDAGIDFYYLDIRTGILLFQHKRMEACIPWFERALEKYPADTVSQEYLYHAMVQTGRTVQARALASGFPPSIQQRVGYASMALQECTFMAGQFFTPNIQDHADDEIRGDSMRLGEALYNGRISQQMFWMRHHFSNGVQLFNQLNLYTTTSTGVVQTIGDTLHQSFRNPQFQYNIGVAWMAGKRASFAVVAGWYRNTWSELRFMHDPVRQRPVFPVFDTAVNAFSASASGSWRLCNLVPALSFTASSFSHTFQWTAEAMLTWYPLGSTRLYTVSSVASLQDGGTQSWILNQKVGGALWPRIWAEAGGTCGDLFHYIGDGGFTVYNTNDPVSYSLSGRLRFFPGHLEISPGYSVQQRSGTTRWFMMPEQPVQEHYTYFTHQFNILLSWKF